MHQGRSSTEFEAVIDKKGRITVPHVVMKRLAGSKKVHVRLSQTTVNEALTKKSVTEEEIERVAAVQLEDRDQVVRFLLTEGSLRNSAGFRQRGQGRVKGSHT
jgi:DNA-binding transcriptional regulator/RsmH inhibitor MraZ